MDILLCERDDREGKECKEWHCGLNTDGYCTTKPVKPEDMTAEWQDGYCEGLKAGREKSIEKFKRSLIDICILRQDVCNMYCCPFCSKEGCRVIQFAEQLKEQKND